MDPQGAHAKRLGGPPRPKKKNNRAPMVSFMDLIGSVRGPFWFLGVREAQFRWLEFVAPKRLGIFWIRPFGGLPWPSPNWLSSETIRISRVLWLPEFLEISIQISCLRKLLWTKYHSSCMLSKDIAIWRSWVRIPFYA